MLYMMENLFAHLTDRYGNKVLVTDELPDGQMVDQWEPVTNDSVKTPLEVYPSVKSCRILKHNFLQHLSVFISCVSLS